MSKPRWALLGLGSLFVTAVGLWVASLFQPEIRFDVGPNTGEYLRGFTESEERPPVSFRWSGERAFVRLPFRAAGSGSIELRVARFLPGSARVHLSSQGRHLQSFEVRSGRFRTLKIPLDDMTADKPLHFELVVEDPDASQLGVAIDWLRVRGLRVRPDHSRASSFWPAALILLSVVGVGLASGTRPSLVLSAVAVGALAIPVWFATDPMGMLHSLPIASAAGCTLVAVSWLWLRKRRFAFALAVLVLLSTLVRGGGVFHPSYFYPDVRNHRRYVTAFSQSDGSWIDRGLQAQKRVHTAYPRNIAGKDYALPYSPLYFVPFAYSGLNERSLERALKAVSLLLASSELLVAFAIGRLLWGERTGFVAASILCLFPPMTSRLFLAMFPTIAGHALELLAMAAALGYTKMRVTPRGLARYLVVSFAACLTYVSSLFNLSAFSMALATLSGKRGAALAATWVGLCVLVVALLYRPFIVTLTTEILPSLAAQDPQELSKSATSLTSAAAMALARIPSFYGWLTVALALVGIGAIRSLEQPSAKRWIVAYILGFGILLALRIFSGGLFKDLKEILFAAPLVALLAARGIEIIREKGLAGVGLALALHLAVIGWCVTRFGIEWARYASLAGLAE